jgi:predicted enzyme related to lactoylglutathione lyase
VNQTQSQSEVPTLFRVTVEVGDLEEAATFYARLFSTPGQRHPGARQYFQCGSVIVAVIDPTQGGIAPSPGPKSLYFAVRDIDAVHQRAAELNALAPDAVHGEPAADVLRRPWGERSFYVVDPWGNDLCFVEEGTLYT